MSTLYSACGLSRDQRCRIGNKKTRHPAGLLFGRCGLTSLRVRRRHVLCVCSFVYEPGIYLNLFNKLRLQPHLADAGHLAIDVVVAVDQADVFDLGADFDHR